MQKGRLVYNIFIILLISMVVVSCKQKTKNQYDSSLEEIPTFEYIPSLEYKTGFESLSDLNGFFITPQGYLGSSFHNFSSEIKNNGQYSYKAWFNGSNKYIQNVNTNHRAYPTIQLYKKDGVYKNKVYIEFLVWLDVNLEKSKEKDWISLATLSTYADDQWQRTLLINVDVDHIVHLMHVPNQGQKIRDIFQTTKVVMPMKEWVNISSEIDFSDNNEYNKPYIKVWQNGQLVSASTFNPRINPLLFDKRLWPSCLNRWNEKSIGEAEKLCDLVYAGGLAQAHFGLYAPPLLESGVIYNDDILIKEIS